MANRLKTSKVGVNLIVMLNIEKCKEVLHKNKKNRFTDDEILKIRELLYKMAKIVIINPKTENNER